MTFFYSLSILSLFSASFLCVFIQLLSYCPSTLMSFWLSYSVSQCNFQSSYYFYLYSPSLLPLRVSSGHISLPSSLPLYQFLQHKYVILLTSTNLISPFLSFYLTPSLCPSLSLSKSVISFFYIDSIFSLSLLLNPANFFAFKSSSLPHYLSLSLSHYLLLLPSLCHCIFLIFSRIVFLSL